MMNNAGGLNDLITAILGARGEAFLLGNGLGEVNTELEKIATAPEKFIESTKTLEKARTIWDYMAEVQSKFKTAFDWRYASKSAADVLYTAWKKVSDNFKEAKKAVQELKTTMKDLVADRSVLEYQLSVAIRYGDTLRANAIQAELNVNADKIAENKTKQAQATQEASRALRGNSEAAIRNRQEMQGLVTSSMAYLTTLKTTSKDTKTLIKSAKSLKEDFMDQGKALGFNAKELLTYSKSFDDFISIINGTSDQLDVSMKTYLNFDGADAALHQWKQQNKDLSVTVKVTNPEWLAYQAGISAEDLQEYRTAKQAIKDGTNNPAAPAKSWKTIVSEFEKKYGKNFASGGSVSGPGSGTSDSIPAMLSNGEYVVRAGAVKAIGVDTLDQLNQADRMKFSGGGIVGRYKDGGLADIFSNPSGWLNQLIQSMFASGGNPTSYLNASAAAGSKGAAKATMEGYKNLVFNPEDPLSWASLLPIGKLTLLTKIPGFETMFAKSVAAGKTKTQPKTLGEAFDALNVTGAARERGLAANLSTQEMFTLKKYVEQPYSLHGYATGASNAKKEILGLILRNKLKIDKGTEIVRVANTHDMKILAGMKPGQTATLDQFFSVANTNHPGTKPFVDGMIKGAVDTGGRGTGTKYPVIKYNVKTDIPGINDINNIAPGVSNVSDGLIVPGTGMKLVKVTKSKDGVLTYHVDLGTNINSKYGLNQKYNINSAKEMLEYYPSGHKYNTMHQNELGIIKNTPILGQEILNYIRANGGKYATGGLVNGSGTGTSDSIPAMLSNGEFVLSAAAVNRYGVGFLNALNNPQGLSMPAQSMAGVGSSSGSSIVYLSPDDRALLRAAIDRPVNLYTENTKIAQSANEGNVLLAQRGRN
jgi:hypothetical protein